MSDIISTIKAQRDGFLDSPTLDPAWKHGWNAAVGHIAYTVEQAHHREQQNKNRDTSPFNLPPVPGCCSGERYPHDGHDVNPPCATVQRDLSIRRELANIWQAGRESIALDMGKPLDEHGMRPATPNPYA